jgi:hypothetical protein
MKIIDSIMESFDLFITQFEMQVYSKAKKLFEMKAHELNFSDININSISEIQRVYSRLSSKERRELIDSIIVGVIHDGVDDMTAGEVVDALNVRNIYEDRTDWLTQVLMNNGRVTDRASKLRYLEFYHELDDIRRSSRRIGENKLVIIKTTVRTE